MPSRPATQIWHDHDIDHQAGPAREMLCPLPLARLGIILFPRKPSPLPFVIHIFDKVSAEVDVDFSSLLAVRTGLLGDVLSQVL